MRAEPPTISNTLGLPIDPQDRSASHTVATFTARILPVLNALNAVLAEDRASLAGVVKITKGQRTDVAAALTAAVVVEADQLCRWAQHTRAHAMRLRLSCVVAEPTADLDPAANA